MATRRSRPGGRAGLLSFDEMEQLGRQRAAADHRRCIFAADALVAQSDGVIVQNQIAVFKPLGGGWAVEP